MTLRSLKSLSKNNEEFVRNGGHLKNAKEHFNVINKNLAFNEIRELQKDIENVEYTITLVHQAITENIAKDFENEEEIKKIYEPRLIFLAKLIETKVK